jgi:hypothetical protein
MLFHEDKQEQLYDYILNHIFNDFSGKIIGSEGCTIEDIKKSLPGFTDDDSSEDEYENATDTREEPVADMQNISESSDDDDDKTDDLEQGKKEEEPEIISDPSDEPCPEPKEEESKEPVKNDESVVVDTKPFTDSIQDEEPVKKEKVKKEKDKKPKKEKKEKVKKDVDPDKPKKLSGYIYFRSNPDEESIELIDKINIQINPETEKPYNNKVKSASIVWGTFSNEVKAKWKQISEESYEEKLKEYQENNQ